MAKATRESFGEAILEIAEKNPNLVVLDADLSKSTMTQNFMKKYPARHVEVGIAEQNMVGIAAGLALSGKIPVLTSFACFVTGRLETIRVSAAYNQTNMKIVGTHAGIGIGEDGTSQMGLEDLAAMRALPHMTVLQPADDLETKQAVRWMIEHKGPVYIRLTRQKMPDVHNADYRWQPGKIDVVWQPTISIPSPLRRRGGRGFGESICDLARQRNPDRADLQLVDQVLVDRRFDFEIPAKAERPRSAPHFPQPERNRDFGHLQSGLSSVFGAGERSTNQLAHRRRAAG